MDFWLIGMSVIELAVIVILAFICNEEHKLGLLAEMSRNYWETEYRKLAEFVAGDGEP